MSRDTDVHTEHCCAVHGCKYGYDRFDAGKPCTVATRAKEQSHPCESCTGGAFHEPEPWIGASTPLRVAVEVLGDRPHLLHAAVRDFLHHYRPDEAPAAAACLRYAVDNMGLPRPVALEALRARWGVPRDVLARVGP